MPYLLPLIFENLYMLFILYDYLTNNSSLTFFIPSIFSTKSNLF